MSRLAKGSATVLAIAAVIITTAQPALACSLVPPVSMEGIEKALTGGEIPDQDQWLLDGATVTGLVEHTVVHEWEATLDYEAASARATTRYWGPAEGRLLGGGISGGEARGPLVSFDTCGPSRAAPFGRQTHTVILDEGGSHPVNGTMTPEIEEMLSSTLGEPVVLDVPEFDDRHPSYEREAYGWQSWLTWGRITWAVAAVLALPAAAFGAWLYSTRRH